MSTLYLSKSQRQTVQLALEHYEKSLRQQLTDKPNEVKRLVEPELFQLELLITWFERQAEMEG